MRLHNFFRTMHSALLQIFHRSNWIWKVKGRLQFRKNPTYQCTKCYKGGVHFFWHETFKVVKIQLSVTWSLPFHYGYCWSYERSDSRKIQAQRKLYHNSSVWRNKKNWNLPCRWRIWSCIFLLGTWDTSSKLKLARNVEWCWQKKDIANQELLTIFSAHIL